MRTSLWRYLLLLLWLRLDLLVFGRCFVDTILICNNFINLTKLILILILIDGGPLHYLFSLLFLQEILKLFCIFKNVCRIGFWLLKVSSTINAIVVLLHLLGCSVYQVYFNHVSISKTRWSFSPLHLEPYLLRYPFINKLILILFVFKS